MMLQLANVGRNRGSGTPRAVLFPFSSEAHLKESIPVLQTQKVYYTLYWFLTQAMLRTGDQKTSV